MEDNLSCENKTGTPTILFNRPKGKMLKILVQTQMDDAPRIVVSYLWICKLLQILHPLCTVVLHRDVICYNLSICLNLGEGHNISCPTSKYGLEGGMEN